MFRKITFFSLFSFFNIFSIGYAQFNPLSLNGLAKKAPSHSLAEKISILDSLSFNEKEKLKTPQETMRTFMLAMEKVKAGSNSAFSDAILTLDLSQIDPALRALTGRITAERLVNTIDRLAKINFSHIPSYEEGPKWIFRKQTVTLGENLYDVEIALNRTSDGVWKFSPETIKSVENFYSSIAHLKVVDGVTEYHNWRSRFKDKMPAWTAEEFLVLKKGQWISLIVLLFLSISIFALIRLIATAYLSFKVSQRSLDLQEDSQFKSTLPFGLLAFSLTWLIAIRFLEFDVGMLEFFFRGSYILTAFSSVWSALKIVDYITLHFKKITSGTGNKFDDVLVPMISKSSKVLVIALGTILIAHSLTFDVASILAGLGIGGVAVALAAKDTISNLFGSVTVLMDRPFQIGDYVSLEKNLEGTVEQVGFRSTRIRTPYNSLVTLPNSVLANMAIDNYGMRRVRRYKTFLQLEYSTPITKIDEFCNGLRALISITPSIQKDNAVVSLYEMSTSSMDILLTVFFMTDEGKIELLERHHFILEILKLAEDLGVKFAYPTQTLFVEKHQG